MASSPFVSRQLEKPSLLRKLLVEPVPSNALIELENRLAQSSDVREVRLEDIHRWNRKYKTDIHRKFGKQLDSLHEAFIRNCLADDAFAESEVAQIFHLQMLFGISDAKHSEIYFRVAEEVYSKSLAEILKSGSLSAEKKEALQSLATQLAIPDDIRNRVFQAEVKHLISDRIDAVLSDRKLSPDEEEELKRLAHSLGASVSYSEAKLGELEECRLRWRIMHSQLPRLDVSLTLQGSECCHYESHAEWHEHRTVTTRFGYSGPSLRIRIAKGLYWNLGQMGVKRHQEEILKKIDEGRLYLTNKRVIFVGQTRSTSIKLAEIINMQPFSDGVEIQKSRGRSPTFVTGASAEFPVMILARLISELR